jgi:5,10-methylenetetrahydromethanopterin reductase
MKFGVRFIQFVGSPRECVNLAVQAENAGFDSVWFPHDTFMHNTWVLTSAVAEHTSRVQIANVGTNPYTTNPAEIATYFGTLDELSQGRALLGLGVHTRDMVEWTGIDASDVIDRTRASVDIIRRLFRGETVVDGGSAYNWTDQCYLRFEPFRREIPIYVGAFGPEYLALSGEIGDGSLPMVTPPESASLMVESIHQGAKSVGRDPAGVDITGCAWLSISEDAHAATTVMRKMCAYFGPYLEETSLATVGLCRADFAEQLSLIQQNRYEEAFASVTAPMLKLGISGNPDDVIERIRYLGQQGISHISLGGPLGPDPAEAIRLMGEYVLPAFR